MDLSSDLKREQLVARPTIAAALAVGVLFVVLAAPATALAAKPYRGKSAQGLPVRLGPKGRFGRTFSYQARMACSDGTTFTDGTFFDDESLRGGRFHDHYQSDRGAVRNFIVGRVRGRRASGRLRVIERYRATANASGNLPLDPHGTIVCDSGSVKWSARQ